MAPLKLLEYSWLLHFQIQGRQSMDDMYLFQIQGRQAQVGLDRFQAFKAQ
jgi:hypothetical protein